MDIGEIVNRNAGTEVIDKPDLRQALAAILVVVYQVGSYVCNNLRDSLESIAPLAAPSLERGESTGEVSASPKKSDWRS